MMILRLFLFFATAIACTNNNSKSATDQSISGNQKKSGINEVDEDFNLFIEKFSKDSAFQLNRTTFPLRIKQSDIANNKDSILLIQRTDFEMIDFRKKKSQGQYDQWEQEIILDKSKSKASIEIRGIDNGIMVDYFFEKKDGKWMLVNIDDSST